MTNPSPSESIPPLSMPLSSDSNSSSNGTISSKSTTATKTTDNTPAASPHPHPLTLANISNKSSPSLLADFEVSKSSTSKAAQTDRPRSKYQGFGSLPGDSKRSNPLSEFPDWRTEAKRREEAAKAASSNSSIEKLGPDSFDIISLLGRGDVGKVFLVQEKAPPNRLFALKALKKSEMIRRNKVKRVLTEREILTTAQHPFIVTLYSSFQGTQRLYFLMDYCAGGEFFRMLQKQPDKCLPEDYVRFYAAEVLMALEYLHLQGFVYRDLKPENILLHASGHIMLSDFDLSKQSTAPNQPSLYQPKKSLGKKKKLDGLQLSTVPNLVTNSFVGTEEYIAPEVIHGVGHTSSVDWWTFGILIYEMLFGFTPYRGRSRRETFYNITTHAVQFPPGKNISSHCKNLIRGLLEPDPKKRLGSQHGAAEIKNQPWFKGIVWALLRNTTPPIVPKFKHRYDISNFTPPSSDSDDNELLMSSSKSSRQRKLEAQAAQHLDNDRNNPFYQFGYQNDNALNSSRPSYSRSLSQGNVPKATNTTPPMSPTSSNTHPDERTSNFLGQIDATGHSTPIATDAIPQESRLRKLKKSSSKILKRTFSVGKVD